ncbi:low temperature requirement protein A [Kibdelosporangium lantanae]
MSESSAVDRHASWLELFFDLVVVVAVNQLAHLLHGDAHHGPGGLDIVTFVTLYLAIWLVWTSFTLYSNIMADRVRVRAMFIGMAGIAAMAAAVPHSMDGRANLFAAAYLITTGVGGVAFQNSGQVLLTWTAAWQNAGLFPWVASFFFPQPWVKLGLWLFGILLTLTFSVLMSRGDQEAILARVNENLAERASRRRFRRRERPLTTVVAARLDAGHLIERLGLFVIIVLGEAMLQVVGSVAGIEDWRPGHGEGWLILLAVVSAFLLLITLWGLNVRHAFTGGSRLPAAITLPAHFVVIASITIVAAGLGTAAAESAEHLNPSTTWLMCGGMTAFLLVVNLLVGHMRMWPARVGAELLPMVAAVLAPWLPAAVVIAVLAVAAGVQLWALSRTRTEK